MNAKIVGILYERVHCTLTQELGVKKHCARWLPHLELYFWASSATTFKLKCLLKKPLVLKSQHLLTHLQFCFEFPLALTIFNKNHTTMFDFDRF